MKLLVTNIQRFCLHDGPGIRTTVFFKGCSLHCPWCCNPENISFQPQFYFQRKKCIAQNGRCPYGDCPFADGGSVREDLALLTQKQQQQCKSGAIGIYGQWYTAEELYNELMKDAPFWGKEGGVTFSGGEPLLQIEALESVLAALKQKGVDLCAETALYVPPSAVKTAVKYFDELYVDVKLLDADGVRNVLGGDLDVYLYNLDILAASGQPVCLRHPQIKGYTDDPATLTAIQALRQKHPQFQYQILAEHHLGNDKYASLGMVSNHIIDATEGEKMDDITKTYVKSPELVKEQQAILLILKNVHKICMGNGISYSLHGGTFLGAIRHHGFIPWDDDGDITFVREEYTKFVAVFKNKESEDELELDNKHRVPKLILRENGHAVAFVDIFIYDYIPNNKVLKVTKIYLDMFFRSFVEDTATLAAAIKREKYSAWKYKLYGFFQKVGALFPEGVPLKFFTFFNSKCLCGDRSIMFRSNDGFHPLDKWDLPTKYLQEYILVPFEDTQLQVFKEYDKILTNYYGDYMTPVQWENTDKEAHSVLRKMI